MLKIGSNIQLVTNEYLDEFGLHFGAYGYIKDIQDTYILCNFKGDILAVDRDQIMEDK